MAESAKAQAAGQAYAELIARDAAVAVDRRQQQWHSVKKKPQEPGA